MHGQDLLPSGLPVVLAGAYDVVPIEQDVFRPEGSTNDALSVPKISSSLCDDKSDQPYGIRTGLVVGFDVNHATYDRYDDTPRGANCGAASLAWR